MRLSNIFEGRPNLMATLAFNFKCFPFKIAVRLPVILFGKVCTKGCKKGCIEIDCDIKPGILKIGYCSLRWRTPYDITSYCNDGKHILKGSCTFGAGSIVVVGKNGELTTGERCWFNANTKIICEEKIVIEDRVLGSWDTQIMDSDLHYTVKQGKIAKNSDSIFVGAYTWICNRATIGRGAFVPANSIVASYSLVNGNFKDKGEKLLLAGIPAVVKYAGIQRVVATRGG